MGQKETLLEKFFQEFQLSFDEASSEEKKRLLTGAVLKESKGQPYNYF